jgi:hypothetical protein
LKKLHQKKSFNWQFYGLRTSKKNLPTSKWPSLFSKHLFSP